MRVVFSNPVFLYAMNRVTKECMEHPMIVFAGRSNVGKSSVINAICGGRFARVSKTPGRTRMINCFSVGDAVLADLPGYGYAQVSKQERQWWERGLADFMQRAPIQCLILIVDCRRFLGVLDEQLLQLCESRDFPHLIVFNKSDKLKNQEKKQLQDRCRAMALPYVLCSSLKQQNIAEIREWIVLQCGGNVAISGQNDGSTQ